MSAGVMGVQNIKEVLDVVLDGVDLGKGALADGKIGPEDGLLLLEKLPKLIGDISAAVKDAGLIVPEAKDLSAEELAELGAHVMGRLAVADAHAVKIVEASLAVLGKVVGLVHAIQGE